MKKTIIIIFSLLILLGLFIIPATIFGVWKFAVFDNVETQTSFEQMVGRYDQEKDPESYFVGPTAPNKVQVFSSTAKMGEYRVDTEKANSHTFKWQECAKAPTGNVHSVTATSIDEDGCQRWKYINTLIEPSMFCDRGSLESVAEDNGYDKCRDSSRDESGLSCNWGYFYCWNEVWVYNYGGMTDKSQTEYGCFGKYEVYQNDKLIHNIDWTKNTSIQIVDNDFFMTFNQNSLFWSSSRYDPVHWECIRLKNNYYYNIPQDSIKLEVLPSKRLIYEDSVYTTQVKISNTWKEIKGNLSILFEVPTAAGIAKKIDPKIIKIPIGETVFEYEIPTTHVTDKLYITPELLVYEDTTDFTGVNRVCNGIKQNVNNCQQINLGKFSGTKYEIQVIPKPLYLDYDGKSCKSLDGYIANYDSSYCIRDDLSDITCIQTGCPNGTICPSSGICSEFIYSAAPCFTDFDCEDYGAVCELDISSDLSYCVKKEIKEEIKEIGVPVYYESKLGCSDIKCSDGYTCESSGDEYKFKCKKDRTWWDSVVQFLYKIKGWVRSWFQ